MNLSEILDHDMMLAKGRQAFDNTQTISEGWWLSERDDGFWEIQKLDDPEEHPGYTNELNRAWDSDFDVYRHLKGFAGNMAGCDPYYTLAIELHGTPVAVIED